MPYLPLSRRFSGIHATENQESIDSLAHDLAAQTLKRQGGVQKPQSRHIDALSVMLTYKD
jgi:hypothetical protein